MAFQYTQFTPAVQQVIDNKYNKISRKVWKYGDNNNLIGVECWRVRNTEKIEFNGQLYKKYAIGFMHHYRYNPYLTINNPNNAKEISHCCGNVSNTEESLCIRGEHMKHESSFYNKQRRKCHNYIREYQRKYNKYNNRTNKKFTIQTRGTLTVGIVTRQKRRLGLHRREYHICSHTPECFINYGKI